MHAEHAELISALRAEVNHANIQLSKMGELRTIIDAQDKLLAAADVEARRAIKIIEEQQGLINELRAALAERYCP